MTICYLSKLTSCTGTHLVNKDSQKNTQLDVLKYNQIKYLDREVKLTSCTGTHLVNKDSQKYIQLNVLKYDQIYRQKANKKLFQ